MNAYRRCQCGGPLRSSRHRHPSLCSLGNSQAWLGEAGGKCEDERGKSQGQAGEGVGGQAEQGLGLLLAATVRRIDTGW